MGSHSKAAVAVAAHAALDTGVHGVGVSTVCSETEADGKITTHKGDASAHHDAPTIQASETLRNFNDAQKTTIQEVYTKLKEVLLGGDLPVCRLKFDLRAVDNPTAYARVYKNGGAIGIEQTAVTPSWSTKSEDFSNWVAGDLIQIYGKRTGTQTCYVRNMRLCYDLVVPVTNQDP